MLWPCQMSMLDLKFTPIELLDHEGRTCLGCSSQFGPACHLNNKLQQGLSKHEENSLYLAQIPVIFWLWTRSANDQSNDTVERQRLFCFEAARTHWPAVTLSLCTPTLTLEHWAGWRLQKLPHNHVVLDLPENKSDQNCHAIKEYLLPAMKTEKIWNCEDVFGICKFGTDGVATWCRRYFSRCCSRVNKCSEWRTRKSGSKYLSVKSDFISLCVLLANKFLPVNVCPAQNAQCNAIWTSGIMAAVDKECGTWRHIV